MKVVVDTNVIVYYLLGVEPFFEEVRNFWRGIEETFAPNHWEAEFGNTIWLAVRTARISVEEGYSRLEFAARLGVRSVPNHTLWQRALTRSLDSGIPVYDTLFVELAAQRRLPLVTFDGKLLEAFPDVARRPASLLSN